MGTDGELGHGFSDRLRAGLGKLTDRCGRLRSWWEWADRSAMHRAVAVCLAFWALVIVGSLTLALPWDLLLKAVIGTAVVGSIVLPVLFFLGGRDDPPHCS